MATRETENNTYAKFWDDKQRALWYVMVFSGVVNILCPLYQLKSYKQQKRELKIKSPSKPIQFC